MTLEHFLNGRNRKNFENRKNAEIAGNRVKNGRFRPSKRQNSDIFQGIYLTFCTSVHLTGRFHIYFGFLKFENFPKCFENNIFCCLFFTIFKIFKILKIRDSSLLATCILNILLKTNCFYHLKCLRDSVSREPLFLPKTGKT